MTYAIEKEKATRIVDIATLTGAVASMFGGVAAGTLSNDDDFYKVIICFLRSFSYIVCSPHSLIEMISTFPYFLSSSNIK